MLERKPDSKFPSLIERFVTYAKIHTTAIEGSETYPSSERQFDLARLLVRELQDLGLVDASVDDKCYVTATLPAGRSDRTIRCPSGFIAAISTSSSGTPPEQWSVSQPVLVGPGFSNSAAM